ncbi:MAG: NPCBM/NEW2 domain-containing protein [Capsulimonas sp.]|uniref:NPCBM/NEW2 domain-containing protein n=1 Tax=Capsulimonas sp. TaxID=2494211 RepID=UPI0032642BD3
MTIPNTPSSQIQPRRRRAQRQNNAIRVAIALPVLLASISCSHAQTAAELAAATPPANAIWLETLDLSQMQLGYGEPHAGKSIDNNPLTLSGTVFPHGIGTHAASLFRVQLHGDATRFSAVVGLDDEAKGREGSITFQVIVDGKTVAQTPVMHVGDAPQLISVDLTKAQSLTLKVGDGGDGNTYDHADWAGAEVTMANGAASKLEALVLPVSPPRLVTPAPDPKPAIHGPRITGVSPGHPFLFRIPATGDGPLTFSAKNLPAGLTLDPNTGIIKGAVATAGTTNVTLTVRGAKGSASRPLSIVVGEKMVARTPPMGWNSWNVWGTSVTEEKVKASAEQLIQSGLAGHGYGYINIDDAWEGDRGADGKIQTNAKFPDMKALGDYIHGLGLRFGIYSSPGGWTCGGFIASLDHEQQDADSYAAWGVDYLKYDWCSYEAVVKGDHSLPALKKPYNVMSAALAKENRDIVFSLCQYGMGDVWTWGAEVGGNAWRTTGDIQDNWGSLHDIYTHQAGHEVNAGPGHWNDPDMLMVGIVGFGNTHPTHLKPNEQILHMSMWCLLSSPLLIGCDMTRLDPFTLALLSNDEALDINQDPLGKPAARITTADDKDVWARPLFDGTHAVGLVNGSDDNETITVKWSDIGVKGKQPVRDLWLHKDLGSFGDSYSVEVPAHGCVLLKVGRPIPPPK